MKLTKYITNLFIRIYNNNTMLLFLLIILSCFKITMCKKLPHIIFILADDLGWYDVGYHGSGDIKTHNIDALAYTGVILDRNYVTPLCTPSRSALMTGKFPIHTGMQHKVLMAAEPWGLSLSEKLLPEYLRDFGYRNHIVGKWHLGHYKIKYTPLFRGFESHLGFWTGHQDYYDHVAVEKSFSLWGHDMRRNLEPAWDLYGKYSTDVFTDESVKIINNHNKSEPLFLYLAHTAVHSGNPFKPLNAPDDSIIKFNNITNYQRQKFAGMLSKLDDSVGKIIDTLKKNSMLNNSIIVFTTDNGGAASGFDSNAASNFPLRGTKGNVWEGSVRGAGLIWSPLLKRPGRTYRGKIHITDWLPTFVGLAGGDKTKLPKNIDGLDVWDSLNNDKPPARRTIVHTIDGNPQYFASVTRDNMKIIKGSNYQGKWDGWYESSTWNWPYNVDAVVQSQAGRAVASLGFSITPQAVFKLRKESQINCGKKDSTLRECYPQRSPCLFDIDLDPCELNNLAVKRPDLLESMLRELHRWNSTVVPPRNVKPNPNANPSFWNHLWTNFGDYPSPVTASS
ncbi:arylsulfatase B isoform X2 [Aphidius gifuensis]|uniref:arylsulfatase B isoform X2 n=1 Tax=Aphidius gifuensis TaxID=684658 RepID=UPI001CDB89B9|nr:arylsulfatase B isoform X2 [Aphidius gifuensis]